jgi:hypothetical protein
VSRSAIALTNSAKALRCASSVRCQSRSACLSCS